MALVMYIISVVLVTLSFFHNPTKRGQRVILFLLTIASVTLGYRASIETEGKIQLAHDQVDRAQAEITEIRTPRRMEPETRRMLDESVKPYAGQKFDMKVFRDQDSLELATAIKAILEEAGWVPTNVYPRNGADYAETRYHGVWLISGKEETKRTTDARTALHGALYDDSATLTPINCSKITGPIQKGTKITPIPCSESSVQIISIGKTHHDDVIPEDTLVLHIGKERL